jgi:predicted HicB family RNase H-like nuclease
MSKTTEYKGYRGCVLYRADDKVLHGRVIEIRDAITHDGTNVCSLEKNFRAALDEYLRFCATQNKSLLAR